jgi:SAM-dependent methyltransferase
MNQKIDILEHNRIAWNKAAMDGDQWSVPVDGETILEARKGNWDVILTPLKPVPKSWFGDIKGKEILCLASGGGQQAPVLAAAGANITSFDNSDKQLQLDKKVADRDSLPLKTIRGDMADLSSIEDAAFDLIFHPVSNVFVPDVTKVWKECFRVLKKGGSLLSGFMNPAFFLFDHKEIEETGILQVRFKLPYSDLQRQDEGKRQELVNHNVPLEFGHLLEDQMGGQIDAGFVITGFYEDWWSDEATLLNRYSPTFISTKATKP